MPPKNERISVPNAMSPWPIVVGAFAIAAKSAVTTRRFTFFARIPLASSVNDGAITASMNVAVSAVADAGATAVVQPGGSVKDAEVIAAADERGLTMVFTGRRHFRH